MRTSSVAAIMRLSMAHPPQQCSRQLTGVNAPIWLPARQRSYSRDTYSAGTQHGNDASPLNRDLADDLRHERKVALKVQVQLNSPENFLSMVESPEFLAVLYKRSDSVELGLNFPFSDHR